MKRSDFLKSLGLVTVSASVGATLLSACGGKKAAETNAADSTATSVVTVPKEIFFKISLAEWSFHKALFDGKMSHLDFPVKAKNDFGITGVEYVNSFLKTRLKIRLTLPN